MQVLRLGLAACGFIWPSALVAQVCELPVPTAGWGWTMSGSVASYRYANSVGAGVVASRFVRDTPGFARIAIDRVRDDELDASSMNIAMATAIRLRNDRTGLFVCPTASSSVGLGPYDFLLSGEDYRYLDVSLGSAIGAFLRTKGRFQFVSTAEVRAVWLHAGWNVHLPGETLRRDGSDVYWLGGAHVSVRFRERLSLRSGITIPFGLVAPSNSEAFVTPFGRENGEISWGLSVSFSFGPQVER